MKQTCILLTDDQRKRLKTLSKETGAPMAELMRRAIDAYLDDIGNQKRQILRLRER